MSERRRIRSLDDYFLELNGRQDQGVYFYRINGYSEEIRRFIKRYYDAARKSGAVIEGKIPNPDEKNLAYYGEIMGMDFRLEPDFFTGSLKKWLPRMDGRQRQSVAAAVYDSLVSMQKAGKTENMLKNAYIKFMCWLYYKFERVVSRLGADQVPKILYEGTVSSYELMLISILSGAGCDVVLLQYGGDQGYRKLDPGSALSDELKTDGMQAFPPGFCLKQIREELQEEADQERLYGARPSVGNCTNAWISGKGLDDIRTEPSVRGSGPGFFYNCFLRINGAEDRLTYAGALIRLRQELKSAGRRGVVVNGEIPRPAPEEIAGVKRGNYTRKDQMIRDLAGNIRFVSDPELQRLLNRAFVDVMLAEDDNLNRLTGRAVYLLCWLKRYLSGLFSGWRMPEAGCFIHMGGCRNKNEALFLRFLARLPVDVLILCPDLNEKCCLEDPLLYEVNYSESLPMEGYPQEDAPVRMGTAAYHAERDLDALMYQDSGMYRNRQYGKANVISLQTMYEEIRLLWDQELKYRPGFDTVGGAVSVPVIFAKVSGVKDGAVGPYWASVKELATEDTLVIRSAPYIPEAAPNPMKAFSAGFLKNGRLQRDKIKNHPNYPYGILREDMQDFMLDKLQIMIDRKLIRGTGENGTEYLVIAQVLNLPKNIVRMIQKFDFTRKNPKLIYINASERILSLEDSILTAFLNLAGFDILFFVPTGYQSIEKHFNGRLMEEHQIGEYLYDLQVPDIKGLSLSGARTTWRDKIFKRGN